MTKIKALLSSAAIALTATLGLCGCANLNSISYASSDKYSVGDTELTSKIENIEIDWLSGSVSVNTHSEDTFLLSENTDDGISDEYRVHWYLDGATLHIKFSASGARLSTLGTARKDLTLTVPDTLILDKVSIDAASATVEASGIQADALSVSTASGKMNISGSADTIKLNSASGSVELTQNGKADEVSIDTASGRIDAKLGRVGTADFSAASGRIEVSASSVESLSADTASGAVSCELKAMPSLCKIDSTSGSVTLGLPEDADFKANVKTTSGSFNSDFALKNKGDTYICGDGSADIDIKTTSGSVSIKRAAK